MKKKSLNLLNPEEIKRLKGGTYHFEVAQTCDQKGDTILCVPFNKVIACKTYKAQCPSGFSSDCNLKKVSITCGGNKITIS